MNWKRMIVAAVCEDAQAERLLNNKLLLGLALGALNDDLRPQVDKVLSEIREEVRIRKAKALQPPPPP